MRKEYVIIGGGVSGLASAFYLNKEVCAEKVLLLEKSLELGGNIGSEKVGGFIFDRGPKGFLGRGRHTLQMVRELGLWQDIRLSRKEGNQRYLWKDNQLNLLPWNIWSIFSSDLVSWSCIVSIIQEYFKKQKVQNEKDETVAEFISRRFSKQILDNFIEAIIHGVYAGDSTKLSAQAIFPKLKSLEVQYGSILRGFFKERKEIKRKQKESHFSPEILSVSKRRLISFEQGMGTLITGLEKRLFKIIERGVQILAIEPLSKGKICIRYKDFLGKLKVYEVGKLILATPSYESAKWLRGISIDLSKRLETIQYAPIKVVCFGYKKKVHSLEGFGFLSTRGQGLKMLGSIWNERIFPHLSVLGGVNLTMMYGGACDQEVMGWSEGKVLDKAQKEIKKVMGITQKPDEVRLFSYDRGIPQYNVGHTQKIQEIQKLLQKHQKIHLVGNYIDGVGVNDCVRKAHKLIGELIK